MSLRLEKVKRSDKREVEKLCEGIWDGNDYLSKVFDAWVNDGGFYKGMLNDKIIALDKYTKIEDNVIWLEGLRVHPEYQGQGYGKEMVEKFLQLIEDNEYYTNLRFMTSSGNEKTIKMAEDFGFEKHLELYSLIISRNELKRKPEATFQSNIHTQQSVTDVFSLIKNSKEYHDNRGLFIKNWTAYKITKDLLKKEVKDGNCIGIGGERLESVVFFYDYEPYNLLNIPFIAGRKWMVKNLIDHGLERIIREKKDYLSIKTGSEKIKKIVQKQSLESTKNKKALIFQK